jgi:hypothetical protein
MRLPSLDRVLSASVRAARRFPLVLTSAVTAAVAGMLLIDADGDTTLLERLLYSSTLGLPLFVGLALLAERRGWRGARGWLPREAGLLVLAVVFMLQPNWSEEVAVLRYLQLSLAFHLFAAFAPYLRGGNLNGFWQYNRTLFLRAVTTAIFAGVLFAGLAGALAGVDNLLGVDVSDVTYGRLWMLVAFVFSTWFFLTGVPDDLTALDGRDDYPAIIKVWPSGWIGYLVSGVAVVGILSLLLVYPIADREENRWIRSYGRWFYVALVPSIAMLLMAIWQRIDQYGVTEKRYFLVVLSLWLAGIAIYFIVTRSRNIKVIPVTLCLVALVTLVGPWGAYAVSHRSQTSRLERLLAANDMLVDGSARPAPTPLSPEDRRELSAIIRYLVLTHGTGGIDPWFADGLARIDTVADGLGSSDRREADRRTELIVNALGVEYVGRWAAESSDRFNFSAQSGRHVIPVTGFDYALRERGTRADTLEFEGRSYRFSLDDEGSTIIMRRDGAVLIVIPLEPVLRRAMEARGQQVDTPSLPADVLHVSAENDLVRVAVYLRRVSGTLDRDGESGEVGYRIGSLSADYYWTEKADSP